MIRLSPCKVLSCSIEFVTWSSSPSVVRLSRCSRENFLGDWRYTRLGAGHHRVVGWPHGRRKLYQNIVSRWTPGLAAGLIRIDIERKSFTLHQYSTVHGIAVLPDVMSYGILENAGGFTFGMGLFVRYKKRYCTVILDQIRAPGRG